jgi:hypothetical protein
LYCADPGATLDPSVKAGHQHIAEDDVVGRITPDIGHLVIELVDAADRFAFALD